MKTRIRNVLMSSDYSSQEVKVLAQMSNDREMIDSFKKGLDFYSLVASKAFHLDYYDCLEFLPRDLKVKKLNGDWIRASDDDYEDISDGTYVSKIGKKRRTQAKSLLLGIMYGRGENSIAEQLGVTLEEAIQLKEDVYKALPKLKSFIDKGFEDIRKKGYILTLWGYKRRLPDFNLPEIQVFYGKTEEDKIINTNVELPSIVSEPIIQKYLSLKYAKRDNFIEKLKKERKYILVDNRKKISTAGRQIANSLIQGCQFFHNLVLDKNRGIVRLGDYINKDMVLWDGEDWTDCWIADSGYKQKCIIKFKDGGEHIASPDHLYQVIKIGGNKIYKKVSELKQGDRVLITTNLPNNNDNVVTFPSLEFVKSSINKVERHINDLLVDNNLRDVGKVLGRLASDGYINRNGGRITWTIAEHEFEIIPLLEKVLKCWNGKAKIRPLRENRTQRLARIDIFSTHLSCELVDLLNIKTRIHPVFFTNTELLCGYLSGLFDGDGYMSDSTLSIKFGKHKDYIPLLKDIHLALKILGIRSKYQVQNDGSQILRVKSYDISLFSKEIGFIKKEKQEKCLKFKPIKDNKSFNGERFLLVNTVEITDEQVPMCDVMNTEREKFMVEGVITHNSSANMTKIALLKMYENEMLKKLRCYPLIPIHDEIIAISPLRYAKKTSELFAKDMEDAPKDKIEVDIKCDVEVFENWAGESIKELMDEELREEKEWKEV